MTESVTVALIGLAGAVLAALIGAYGAIKAARPSNPNERQPGKGIAQTAAIAAILGLLAGLGLGFWIVSLGSSAGWFQVSTAIPLAQLSSTPQQTVQAPTIPTAKPLLDVYDTFDNSNYDGTLNQLSWVVNPDDEMAAYQDSGRLVFQASAPSDYGTLWINPSTGVSTGLQNYNAIEAEFSWDPEINNGLYLGLGAEQSWSPRVAYVCDFRLTNDSSFLNCSEIDGDETHSAGGISVEPNKVYTLRLEIDPVTAAFVIYLNNSIVDTYEPPNPDKWLRGPVSYNLHLGADPNSSGTCYVDNVRFGQVK